MNQKTAKLFMNGRSQAVRLPAIYRFNAQEVFIRKDPETGDIILSRKPEDWDDFFIALKGLELPEDFLAKEERSSLIIEQNRDPFEGWNE